MRALSLWRPWPWAIMYGDKRVENRDWRIDFRGDVVFHGTKKFDAEAVPFIERTLREGGFKPPIMLPSAHPEGLLFVATIEDCLPADAFVPLAIEKARALLINQGLAPDRVDAIVDWSERQAAWAFGPWCAMLENVRPFKTPIPWKGKQGWFNVPDEIVAEALGGAA